MVPGFSAKPKIPDALGMKDAGLTDLKQFGCASGCSGYPASRKFAMARVLHFRERSKSGTHDSAAIFAKRSGAKRAAVTRLNEFCLKNFMIP